MIEAILLDGAFPKGTHGKYQRGDVRRDRSVEIGMVWPLTTVILADRRLVHKAGRAVGMHVPAILRRRESSIDNGVNRTVVQEQSKLLALALCLVRCTHAGAPEGECASVAPIARDVDVRDTAHELVARPDVSQRKFHLADRVTLGLPNLGMKMGR